MVISDFLIKQQYYLAGGLATGISGVGVGSSLVNLKLKNAGKWDELRELTKKYTRGVKN